MKLGRLKLGGLRTLSQEILRYTTELRRKSVTDPTTPTPCEQHDGRWYKRDDLFMPFEDIPLSGGKVRQAIQLLERRVDYIRRECGNTVLTATGIHSPQGLIIARVCQSFDVKCVVFSGTRNGQLGPM